MNKQKLLLLVGPTAVGKTALSIEIAQKFDLEVISGDSMQIYKHMDIGTGKITEEEKDGITHHMLDIVSPDQEYSVGEYQEAVHHLIDEKHNQNELPFIVGGTGLYIKSLIYENYTFNDENQEEKDAKTAHYEQFKNAELYAMLESRIGNAIINIHPNNRRRVIRTLIRHDLGGLNNKKHFKNSLKYDIFIVGLRSKREDLYARINARVTSMMHNGLLEEVQHLHDNYQLSKTARAAIGYKEFDDYFKGHLVISDVETLIQQRSRQYAKRQLTFFRNQLPVNWYDLEWDNVETIMEDIQQFINR